MKKKYDAVVLLSGGLDSAVNLALAVKKWENVLALTVDYKHRAAKPEMRAAKRLARHYQCRHLVVDMWWMKVLLPRALSGVRGAVPRTLRPEGVEAVWVPNRNGLFIAVAAAFAEAYAAKFVVAGFNAEEGALFPDNSIGFIDATNDALRYSTRARVKVTSFTAAMNKRQIVTKGVRLGLPFKYVYPCYAEGPLPCGRCSSCRRAALAFVGAGFPELVDDVFGRGNKNIDISLFS